VLAATGGGRFSLDRLLGGRLEQMRSSRQMERALLALENEGCADTKLPV
jgi:hypothetical protein